MLDSPLTFSSSSLIASLPRLDILASLDPSRDLRVSGQVIYVGNSSMEVVVKMEAIGNDLPEETVLIGRPPSVLRGILNRDTWRD